MTIRFARPGDSPRPITAIRHIPLEQLQRIISSAP